MNLVEAVAALPRPAPQQGLYSAVPVDEHPGVRIGIDATGAAGVFFEISNNESSRRKFALESLVYNPEVLCTFDGTGPARRCAILQCLTDEDDVQELFLRVVESWLPTVPSGGHAAIIDAAVARLIDLFDTLRRPGTGTVLGLWGELFVMLVSDDPREMVRAWRCDTFELHDFVNGAARLEVKTASVSRRHYFRLEQLLPLTGVELTICSIVTRPSLRGESVADLCARLRAMLNDDQLAFRIEQTIASTLGERWRELTSQRYLWSTAVETLAFYEAAAVPSVNPTLPPEVSHVSFMVELDGIEPIAGTRFPGVGNLRALRR